MAGLVSQVFSVLISLTLVLFLGACGQSKKSGGTAAALAPIAAENTGVTSGSGDAVAVPADQCKEDDNEGEDEEDDIEVEVENGLALKKDKPKKDKKVCVPSTGVGSNPAATGSASLVEGQKIYTANCQICHGALPGQKQGRSAEAILAAASLGTHKSITPWPAAAASTLSAELAAESLALVLK
ncbi:hypothetical protein [Oligoflexus tunisiensis]|uniref:hypothetical protein n=1 Tax=Oligoflexus tunisiensis TaxID=708132 RepID=UPI00114D31C2|nr:hypothetical protein [Oligoflexus tunisiensis]